MPLSGAKPVFTPYRGGAYHRFTGGYDYKKSEQETKNKRNAANEFVFKDLLSGKFVFKKHLTEL